MKKKDKEIDFDTWWFTLGNQHKAEEMFGEEAERICNELDPNLEVDNLYSDTLERLAKENNMHLHN